MTTIILKVLDAIMGLRVSDEDEMAGLDLSQHSETAYALGGSPTANTRRAPVPGLSEPMRAAEARARGGH